MRNFQSLLLFPVGRQRPFFMWRVLFVKPFPCVIGTRNRKTVSRVHLCRCFCSIHSSIENLSGIFPVYKPANCTSFDVVKQIRSILLREMDTKNLSGKRRKWVKVGHGGTLDPFATGVLVIAVGSACSQLDTFLQGSKRYKATLKFGEETDTMDNTGKVVETKSVPHISLDHIQSVVSRYRGVVEQVVPAYSAVHVNGKRAYEWARKGVDVPLPTRKVRIDDIQCTCCCMPIAELQVECGGGTYIRRLVSDIAKDLQTVGHLIALERTKQGPFHLQDAVSLDDCRQISQLAHYLQRFANPNSK